MICCSLLASPASSITRPPHLPPPQAELGLHLIGFQRYFALSPPDFHKLAFLLEMLPVLPDNSYILDNICFFQTQVGSHLFSTSGWINCLHSSQCLPVSQYLSLITGYLYICILYKTSKPLRARTLIQNYISNVRKLPHIQKSMLNIPTPLFLGDMLESCLPLLQSWLGILPRS